MIGVFIIFIMISAICFAITRFCRTTKPRTRPKAQKYALLESQDNEVPACKSKFDSIQKRKQNSENIHFFYKFLVNRTISSLTETDDTDSDVLFENQNKSNGVNRANGVNKNNYKHYATTRLGRRIKA